MTTQERALFSSFNSLEGGPIVVDEGVDVRPLSYPSTPRLRPPVVVHMSMYICAHASVNVRMKAGSQGVVSACLLHIK